MLHAAVLLGHSLLHLFGWMCYFVAILVLLLSILLRITTPADASAVNRRKAKNIVTGGLSIAGIAVLMGVFFTHT
jgi:uncharacterized membrane protein